MRKAICTLSIIIIGCFCSGAPVTAQQPVKDLQPTLILISLDGFRADYLSEYPHPTIDKLRRDGVSARWMTPSFPSSTFPNHYTIATGLYPEHTGIVANDIYDPVFDAQFALGKRAEVQNGRWWGGEPIWITAEKAGQKASATFWPGSEAEIRGLRPSYWKPYEDKVTPAERVDGALALLDLPRAQRPTFLTLYFSNVDHAGHENSPKSPEVAEAIGIVDSAIKRLISGLRARNIHERVNLIVVSDHGMTAVPPQQKVIMDDYFDPAEAQHVEPGGEVLSIFPKAGDENRFFRSIKRAEMKHARCYRKQDIPARFHYRDSRRIGAIVCMPEEGWLMTIRARWEQDNKKAQQPTHVRGAHGYDNQLRSMRAIFIARGPAFKRHTTVRPFPNVDVYNVMTQVLKLRAAKNDGSAKTARGILR
jgi:predicted AlkP superfamily pyrophosphatase or phosphodiesterase